MKMNHIIVFVLGLVFMVIQPLMGQEKQPFSPEKLWQMQRIGDPEVSPDGVWSAFTVTKWSIEENASETDIYLVHNQTGEKRRLTHTGKEGGPVWSPDGRQLAFVSRRHGGPGQVYILPIDGGEAKQITDLPVGVFGLKWFPDGKRLAFGANIHPDYNGDWEKLRTILRQRRESKVTAKVTENALFRFWDRWLTDGMYGRLFALDIASGKVTDLMPHTANFFNMMGGVSYDISPDGKTIALSMNSTAPPYNRLNYDIFLLPADGSGSLTNITPESVGDDTDPVFSPDGRRILFGRQTIYHFYADKVVMHLYDVASGGFTNLTQHIDLSCQDWFWSPDGRTIYFLAEHLAMQSIFSIPAAGGRHQLLHHSGTNTGAAEAGPNRIIFSHHNLSNPAELYRLDLGRRGGVTRLTRFNDALVKTVEWGKIENVTYTGANGAPIQMFINYPPNYDPTKKYPLVVMIHGGPHATFGDFFHYRWNSQLFASRGYIAIMPNFHGSSSFGQDFTISIHGEHANKPFIDVMEAVDYMIERGLVDSTRMAAAGGSYGGYLVSWIAGKTNRFAALVNHAGVYDLHLQFASDYGANRPYQYGGSPWENFDVLNSQNPAQLAANFQTPMLIIHGELDFRVPVAHAFLVYGIYKGRGLESRLVYFPDENHWILTPQNSIFWYNEVLNWFDRFLAP